MGLITDLRSTSRLGLMVAATAAALGVIYGYDSSNIAGALLFLANDLHLSTHDQEVAATAVVIGEIAGAIAGGPLSNRIGRKRSMVLVAATFGLFSLLSALAFDLTSLVGARFLLGVTVGISVVVVPVFVAESSPTKIRGSMLVLYQVACVTGIIAGYLIAWALASTGSWRIMLGLAAIPAALVLIALLKLPDTARWHMLRGDRERAREILGTLDPEIDVDHELDEIAAALKDENGGSLRHRLRDMITPPYRRATIFVVVLGFFIQITGINAVVYYSPRIFEAMGMTGYSAKLGLPALVQVAALIAVFISMSTIDRMGRRPILLTGIAIMVVAYALLAGVFAVGGSEFGGMLTVLGFLGIVLVAVGFTFGFGSLVWVYAGESFPARLRSYGASAMLTSDLVANAVVAYWFLSLLTKFGGAVSFAVFGCLAIAAFVFVYLTAPETKGHNLEDIRHFWESGGKWPGTS
ncbi:sugar porter family MFS transporter [Mycobacterium sp. CBMA271]|uniref:sugar porter family MFS transporter n=1 Tax=unclassified Mycobacteroides TaxID=2618759 RepID=UPI0012DF0FC1|nr:MULTISPECIES: sugar porter family MFS transporter [unclassified Mycobacteroides]MUM19692.1 MFS transporter [Mycobacteroides sp. CBMA 326]MUM24296.1 sugar porter family MFS transporter [Mycobacteroides sp. CBMA 271]